MGACGALGFSQKQETGITRTGTVRRRKAGQSSSLLTFVYWRWWMAWMPLFVCNIKNDVAAKRTLRPGETGEQFRGHTGPGPHTVGRCLCAVQAFWADGPKPWRRANSFLPSIVIKRVEPPSGRRNPKRRTRLGVSFFLEYRNTIDASNFYCKMTSLGTLDIFLAFFFKWLKMNNKVS